MKLSIWHDVFVNDNSNIIVHIYSIPSVHILNILDNTLVIFILMSYYCTIQ